MKLQIKTLNQKSLVIDIDDTQTVYQLKKELALYADIGVKPELQKLIYAGKILSNEDKLNSYNIDVKKFLVIMILKQPLEESPKVVQEKEQKTEEKSSDKIKIAEESPAAAPIKEPEFKTPTDPAPVSCSKTDELVTNIVGMGYPEFDVRRALKASFNNPERAIEYLIEGIPTSPSTPDGDSYSDTDADLSMTPFEVFRGDPMFQNLRSALQQHPELIDDAIQRVGETNPGLMNLIIENQQEFVSMLVDGSDDDDVDDMEADEDSS